MGCKSFLKTKLVASRKSRMPSFRMTKPLAGHLSDSLYLHRFIENIEDAAVSFSPRPSFFDTVLYYYFP